MTTAQLIAQSVYQPIVQGMEISEDEAQTLIEDNITKGRAYGLVTEGLLELKAAGRVVVPILSGSAPGLALSNLWRQPRVTIRCGSCARTSKSEVIPLTINGTHQESSLVYCECCGTPNIANVYC